MAQPRISPSEIDTLARKLDRPDGLLSERERGIVRFLLDLARQAIDTLPPEASDGATPNRNADAERPMGEVLPRLIEGFENAYQPGLAAEFTFEGLSPAADAAAKQAIKVRLV